MQAVILAIALALSTAAFADRLKTEQEVKQVTDRIMGSLASDGMPAHLP